MIELIPAIDIIEGKCVRLTKGDYDTKKVYGDPLDMAQHFEDLGVKRLHVVDLDGAKSKHVVNLATLKAITTHTKLIVDFGGGIKTDEDLEKAYEAGESWADLLIQSGYDVNQENGKELSNACRELKVDFAIYAMAVIYVITALFYLMFEVVIINYRPILEDGELEASFPSSHTMLAVSVFGSAIVYAIYRIKDDLIKKIVVIASAILAAGMALGRLISGVHWFTDILGGVLLGCAIVSLYMAFVLSIKKE